MVHEVADTVFDITLLPSTETLIFGAPEHWSPRARTVSFVIFGVVTVFDAVALLQTSSPLPPLAELSENVCPEPEGRLKVSASRVMVEAAVATVARRPRTLRATARETANVRLSDI